MDPRALLVLPYLSQRRLNDYLQAHMVVCMCKLWSVHQLNEFIPKILHSCCAKDCSSKRFFFLTLL